MDIANQILASLDFSSARNIVVAAGLALIGIAFVSYVLRQAQSAASGNIGAESDDEEND